MASNQDQASYSVGVGEAKGHTQTQEKTGQVMSTAKDQAAGLTDAAKQKASETAEYTKESAVAGKDRTDGVLQQATETVVGTKDAVANTLGMSGDNTTKNATTTGNIVTRDLPMM